MVFESALEEGTGSPQMSRHSNSDMASVTMRAETQTLSLSRNNRAVEFYTRKPHTPVFIMVRMRHDIGNHDLRIYTVRKASHIPFAGKSSAVTTIHRWKI